MDPWCLSGRFGAIRNRAAEPVAAAPLVDSWPDRWLAFVGTVSGIQHHASEATALRELYESKPRRVNQLGWIVGRRIHRREV